jgi:hypothetical protein
MVAKDSIIKLSVYVNEWQQVVKIKYIASPDEPYTILSKDEKTKLTISIGQSVTVHYFADMTARNWKRRMILRIV